MKIKLTKQFIENGYPGSSDRCPIALAMRAEGCYFVEVESDTVSYKTPYGKSVCAPLPEIAEEFVMMFDQYPERHHLMPIEFDLPD